MVLVVVDLKVVVVGIRVVVVNKGSKSFGKIELPAVENVGKAVNVVVKGCSVVVEIRSAYRQEQLE